MNLTAIDLGQFNIVSSTSGLRLDASAQAQFAPSAEDVIDLSSLLTRDALIDGSLQHLWISRGSCFRLVISLHIDQEIWIESFNQLSEIIAAAIVHAKLWKQLQLDLTGLEVSEDVATGLISFTLSLDHLNSYIGDMKGKVLHKLDRGVPAHHVRPPAGISRAELQSIDLLLELRGVHTPNSNTTSAKGAAASHEEGVSAAWINDDNAHEYLKIKADADDETFCRCSISSLHNNNESWLTLNEDERPLMQNTDDLFGSLDYDRDAFSHRTSCSGDGLSSEKTILLETDPLLERRQSATHEMVVELIDAAMRASIVASPKALRSDIKVAFDTQFLHLSRLAPSLWCPQFVQSISSQALFIPTISHALANVSRRVDGSKAQNLGSERTRQASTKLWTLLVVSAPQRHGAQQLSPLQFPSYGRGHTSQSCDSPSASGRNDGREAYYAQTSQDGRCDEDDLLFDDQVELLGTDILEGWSGGKNRTLSALHKTNDEVLIESIDGGTAATMGEASGRGGWNNAIVRSATVVSSAREPVHDSSLENDQSWPEDMLWS